MGAVTEQWSAPSALTISLNSLANGTYVAASAVDLTTPDPLDVAVEVALTPGTVSGNKQALVFVKVSFDGSNYSSGPESSTTTTDEPDLYQIGALPLNTNSALQRKTFSLLSALGFVPPYFKLIVKNESGAALAGSGNSASYSYKTGNVA